MSAIVHKNNSESAKQNHQQIDSDHEAIMNNNLHDYIRKQMSEIRSLTCTNNIMHAMLRGQTEAVCSLSNENELKLHHGSYNVERSGDTYNISWSKNEK